MLEGEEEYEEVSDKEKKKSKANLGLSETKYPNEIEVFRTEASCCTLSRYYRAVVIVVNEEQQNKQNEGNMFRAAPAPDE